MKTIAVTDQAAGTAGPTAWQGLFEHGRLQTGQSVLVHGAAGAVGSIGTQLAREAGAYVFCTSRAPDRQKSLDFGAKQSVDLDGDALEEVGEVDLVFDVLGGDIGRRSAGLIRAGGTLVSVVGPSEAGPAEGWGGDSVVESSRERMRDERLRTTLATSRCWTMPLPPSTRVSDARGRRSSAFVRERHAISHNPGRFLPRVSMTRGVRLNSRIPSAQADYCELL